MSHLTVIILYAYNIFDGSVNFIEKPSFKGSRKI